MNGHNLKVANILPCKTTLYDMHCHVGFCPDAPAAAAALAAEHIAAFSCSVLPGEYQDMSRLLAGAPNVRVALGLHPWWVTPAQIVAGATPPGGAFASVAEGSVPNTSEASGPSPSALEQFITLSTAERYIGEVGIDLSPSHAQWQDLQQAAFRRIVRTCTLSGNKVLSIHAVRSASLILDELNDAGAFRLGSGITCIFHWFSGTPSEMKYAQEAGCYFSINPRMLQSKRGRFYAQNVPLGQLLLETDAPANQGDQISAPEIRQALEGLLANLAQLRHVEVGELSQTIAENSKALLGL